MPNANYDQPMLVTQLTKMSKVMFGIFQNDGGINAYPSGSFASHTKKKTKIGQASKKGTRNFAVLKPYDAPRVRPRMRRMIEKSIEKHPTKSSLLNFSL